MGGQRVSKQELFRGLFQGSIFGGLRRDILEDFDDFGVPLGSLFGDIWPLFEVSLLGSFFGGLNTSLLAAGAGSLGLSNLIFRLEKPA